MKGLRAQWPAATLVNPSKESRRRVTRSDLTKVSMLPIDILAVLSLLAPLVQAVAAQWTC